MVATASVLRMSLQGGVVPRTEMSEAMGWWVNSGGRTSAILPYIMVNWQIGEYKIDG